MPKFKREVVFPPSRLVSWLHAFLLSVAMGVAMAVTFVIVGFVVDLITTPQRLPPIPEPAIRYEIDRDVGVGTCKLLGDISSLPPLTSF